MSFAEIDDNAYFEMYNETGFDPFDRYKINENNFSKIGIERDDLYIGKYQILMSSDTKKRLYQT
jgi:hypothetical protein